MPINGLPADLAELLARSIEMEVPAVTRGTDEDLLTAVPRKEEAVIIMEGYMSFTSY